jgi:hypothetical protein
MRAFATAEATGAGGGGGRGAVGILALVGLVVAVAFAIGWGAMQVRDTVMASDPAVAAARARQAAAEADLRAGELQRQNRAEQATAIDSLTWGSRISTVGHVVEIGVLAAVLAAVVGALVGAGLLFRRHLSLPTKDGRVPLVGLDREFSLDASQRYQALISQGPTFEALPVSSVEEPSFKRVWKKAMPESEHDEEGSTE